LWWAETAKLEVSQNQRFTLFRLGSAGKALLEKLPIN